MTADTSSLTYILDQFLNVFKLGQSGVAANAWSLLSILATIELLLASLWWALTGQDIIVGFIKKILSIGFFVFVVQNYDFLLKQIIDGFIQTGKIASAGGDAFASVRDPSTIIDAGFIAVTPVFDYIRSLTGSTVLFSLPNILISLFGGLGILLAYFIIAIQVFVTYLEFGIISTLGLILVPFGVFKHTAFIAEKVFGAVISFGVKLMVLGFLVSVTVPVLKNFNLPADPSWANTFNLLAISFAVAALSWHAPGLAAGLLSGAPSITAGTAAGTALAGTAGSVGSVLGGIGALKTAGAAAAGITKFASHSAGIATGGFAVGGAKAAMNGGGTFGNVSSGVMGSAKAITGAGWNKMVAKPAAAVKKTVSESFNAGRNSVPSYIAQKEATQSGASAGQTSKENIFGNKASTGEAKPNSQEASGKKQTEDASLVSNLTTKPIKPRNKLNTMASYFHYAKDSIPQTAMPSAGTTVPLKRDEYQ